LDEGAKGGKQVASKEGNMDAEPIQTKFMQVLPVVLRSRFHLQTPLVVGSTAVPVRRELTFSLFCC